MKHIFITPLTLILTSSLLLSCQISGGSSVKKQDGKIPIVTTNEVIGIHTKMVAGEKAFVVSLDPNHLSPTTAEKELIYDAGIIMSDFPIAGGPLEKVLQKYTGTYLNVGTGESKRQNPAKITEVTSDIEKIRNTLSEMDPENTGFYYDNAGTYIHLLNDTYSKLNKRLDEYNKLPFITIGADMSDFLKDFGLQKYKIKHLEKPSDTNTLLEKITTTQKKHPVTIIFTDTPLSKETKEALKKKYNIITYTLARIEEDTSNWGYLRFIEKRINTFVEAYDTYD